MSIIHGWKIVQSWSVVFTLCYLVVRFLLRIFDLFIVWLNRLLCRLTKSKRLNGLFTADFWLLDDIYIYILYIYIYSIVAVAANNYLCRVVIVIWWMQSARQCIWIGDKLLVFRHYGQYFFWTNTIHSYRNIVSSRS